MIAFIIGKVVNVNEGAVIIENNGIGYDISVSNNTLVKCIKDEQAKLFTYMHIKENDISLYGFFSEEERIMFLRLISISGIGPKVALSVLSGMRVNDIALAILNGDASGFAKIKGLGKKTAERIILELRGKVSPMEALIKNIELSAGEKAITGEYAEAVTVLMSLGLTKGEAIKNVRAAEENGLTKAEDILNFALKNKF